MPSAATPSTSPSSTTPAPDAGPRLQVLPQQGRGALFFVVMFGLVVLMGLRAIVFKGELLAPTALLLIGLVGLFAVHRFRQVVLRQVAVHEGGLVLVRGRGAELLPWADVAEVRRDVGPDERLAYVVRLPGDRVLRLRVPPQGTDAQLQTFVELLAARAGLTWSGTRAQRAA